jgi:hypothetical protein
MHPNPTIITYRIAAREEVIQWVKALIQQI